MSGGHVITVIILLFELLWEQLLVGGRKAVLQERRALNQGCQRIYIVEPKIPIWVNFGGSCY
jgi:hypothetical protein